MAVKAVSLHSIGLEAVVSLKYREDLNYITAHGCSRQEKERRKEIKKRQNRKDQHVGTEYQDT